MFGWGEEKPEKTVRRYIEALNLRDMAAMADMIGDTCRFVDSRGGWIEGRDTGLKAHERFFEMEDNFRIIVDRIVEHNGDILITGYSQADDPRLAGDTLWRARAEDGQLTYWQSYGEGDLPALAHILMPEAAHDPMDEPAD